MTTPKIMAMGNSMRTFPLGNTTQRGRRGSLVQWAAPITTPRHTIGGKRILVATLPLRGERRG